MKPINSSVLICVYLRLSAFICVYIAIAEEIIKNSELMKSSLSGNIVISLLYDALIRLQSLLARWFAVNLILICHSQ
ncbi:hypothetical protein PN450_05410 [Dolichospermum lemmermannii CS-548]|uniref:hypothetical protein n=1 Tax=Dolichospermum lemmermannii TaxID=54295 RepID=UPI00232BD759|nr:hypothetical protein [Dolichospermum lemmermannii]MDB9436255.1 hypothetical protein [Dolichospermum lemmermannii CS-548]